MSLVTIDTLDLQPIQAGDHITILVHPGSSCGSANFNLGFQRAQAARAGLIEDLQTVQGHLLVLKGELDDEIAHFPELSHALSVALEGDGSSVRAQMWACDPDQIDIATTLAERLGPLAAQVTFEITGAWLDDYKPNERGGCVGSVYEALKAKGLSKIAISDNAVVLADF